VERKADFNCGDYRFLLESDFALSKREVNLNRYEDKLCLNPLQCSPDKMSDYLVVPFREWATDNGLPWWEAFTDLKHDRLSNFHKASLKNALYSLAGVFMVLTLREEAEFKAGIVPPELYDLFFPKYWNFRGRIMPGNFVWS
jgi:hypothetical protein